MPAPSLPLRLSRAANDRLLNLSYRLRRARVWGLPQQVMIEPINACNARCPLCPTGRRELNRPVANIALATVQHVVDQVASSVRTLPLWNYGEPFLHPQLFDMIHYAHGRHISVVVSTNGLGLYDPADVPRIVDSGLNRLIVSLDGATPQTLAVYRVGVDLERVLAGLRLLAAEKQRRGVTHPEVIWQFIVMSHNRHEIEPARRLAGEVGTRFMVKTVSLDLVDWPERDRFLPELEEWRRYEPTAGGGYAPRLASRRPCPMPWYSLVVNSSGQVLPCCVDTRSEMVLGDVHRQSIRDIWNGPAMQDLRRALARGETPGPCERCTLGSLSLEAR